MGIRNTGSYDILLAYCHGMKIRHPHLTEAIGIASEPFSEAAASQDFLYVELADGLSSEESAHWEAVMEELYILQTPANETRYFGGISREFPMPFSFGTGGLGEYEISTPMNRADRRRIEKEARKAAKKNGNPPYRHPTGECRTKHNILF